MDDSSMSTVTGHSTEQTGGDPELLWSVFAWKQDKTPNMVGQVMVDKEENSTYIRCLVNTGIEELNESQRRLINVIFSHHTLQGLGLIKHYYVNIGHLSLRIFQSSSRHSTDWYVIQISDRGKRYLLYTDNHISHRSTAYGQPVERDAPAEPKFGGKAFRHTNVADYKKAFAHVINGSDMWEDNKRKLIDELQGASETEFLLP